MVKERRRSRLGRRRWLLSLALLGAVTVAFFLYATGYYRADEGALAAMESDDSVRVVQTDYGWLFDGPSDAAALIFYPGAKVEERAYAPLMRALAQRGLDTGLVQMPLRTALLDVGAAGDVMKAHDYPAWFIGGHSLGGYVATGYAADHPENLSGLVLLAAYPAKALPEDMPVLSLVGSRDGVINRKRLEGGRRFIPGRLKEVVIEGGNHAQFGSYGFQAGDGAATITAGDQRDETVRAILDWMKSL